jgi:DNA-binding GntR family transcriptional regulator
MLNGPEERAVLEAAATLTQERIEKAKQKRRAQRGEQAEQDTQGFQDESASAPQEVRAEALWLLM